LARLDLVRPYIEGVPQPPCGNKGVDGWHFAVDAVRSLSLKDMTRQDQEQNTLAKLQNDAAGDVHLNGLVPKGGGKDKGRDQGERNDRDVQNDDVAPKLLTVDIGSSRASADIASYPPPGAGCPKDYSAAGDDDESLLAKLVCEEVGSMAILMVPARGAKITQSLPQVFEGCELQKLALVQGFGCRGCELQKLARSAMYARV
jgi:hypothetical protein